VKILAHYKEIFKWQPNCFVVLGGNAKFLKQTKEFPKEISHVKIVVLDNY
jgi:transcription initiation factor IIF auxiliary subunit